jgi:hypothetical protein
LAGLAVRRPGAVLAGPGPGPGEIARLRDDHVIG